MLPSALSTRPSLLNRNDSNFSESPSSYSLLVASASTLANKKLPVEILIDFITENLNDLSQYYIKYVTSEANKLLLKSNSHSLSPPISPIKSDLSKFNYSASFRFDFQSIESIKIIWDTFEKLTFDIVSDNDDNELYRTLKGLGWSGNRFRTSNDPSNMLQSLSNLYLKQKHKFYNNKDVEVIKEKVQQGNKIIDEVTSYCPDTLLKYFEAHSDDSDKKLSEGASSFSFEGACMLVDISGFSAYSGSMCSKGVLGLDELRTATKEILGYFVDTVYGNGGDVIAFAGDALICVFLPSDCFMSNLVLQSQSNDSNSANEKSMISDCCYRALQCACSLKDYEYSTAATSLKTHIGVSFGKMTMAMLGGLNDQRVYLMNGHCVSELAECIHDAEPMQVVVTAECYRLAILEKGLIGMSPLQNSKNKNIRINFVSERNRRGGLVRNGTKGGGPVQGIMRQATINIKTNFANDRKTNLLYQVLPFVPPPVLHPASDTSLDRIGELRIVTTMFLSLDSYSEDKHNDPKSLQPFFSLVQELLRETGGFLRQFLVDDKGCVLIAMWGVPTYTFANNCTRALYCAASIRKRSVSLDHKCSIGVTTGTIFCGVVGSKDRRDFVGIGSEVNIAARLMCKANGGILLDEKTYQNLNEIAKKYLAPGESLLLKGIAAPVTPYKFNNWDDSLNFFNSTVNEEQRVNIGASLRPKVKRMLTSNINAIACKMSAKDILHDLSDVNVTAILGLPGTGKSAAAKYFKYYSNKLHIECITLTARKIHSGVPYGVILELFYQFNDEEKFNTKEKKVDELLKLIEEVFKDSSFREKRAALYALGVVFDVDITSKYSEQSSQDQTISMSELADLKSRKRYRNVKMNSKKLLPNGDLTFNKILCHFLQNAPITLVIENCQFCDELSWVELNLLLKSRLRLSVLLTIQFSANGKDILPKNKKIVTIGGNSNNDSFSSKYEMYSEIPRTYSTADNDEIVVDFNDFLDSNGMNQLPIIKEGFDSTDTHSTLDSLPKKQILLRKPNNNNDTNQFKNIDNIHDISNETTPVDTNHTNRLRMAPLTEQVSQHAVSTASSEEKLKETLFDIFQRQLQNNATVLEQQQISDSSTQKTASKIISIDAKIQQSREQKQKELLGNYKRRTSLLAPNLGDLPVVGINTKIAASMDGSSKNTNFTTVNSSIKNTDNGVSNNDSLFPTVTQQQNDTTMTNNDNDNVNSTNNNSIIQNEVTSITSTRVRNNSLRTSLGFSQSRLGFIQYDAYISILEHPKTQIIVLDSLTKTDIKNLLYTVLGVDKVSKDLVTFVFNVTSGNPYWCNDMANFIKDYDMDYVENAMKECGSYILCRIERLAHENKQILKYASIIGSEFSFDMIFTVLKETLNINQSNLIDNLEELVLHGFLVILKEYPFIIYGFENPLVQSTLYELMPPRDASEIHLCVAKYIENTYQNDKSLFYPSLAYHYKKCPDEQHNAFKYKLKAADYAVSLSAYKNALEFAESAFELARTVTEFHYLLKVLKIALDEMEFEMKSNRSKNEQLKSRGSLMQIFSMYNISTVNMANSSLINEKSVLFSEYNDYILLRDMTDHEIKNLNIKLRTTEKKRLALLEQKQLGWTLSFTEQQRNPIDGTRRRTLRTSLSSNNNNNNNDTTNRNSYNEHENRNDALGSSSQCCIIS
eukprot:gene14054-18852_t